jgi:rhodanese-related sulfurtransferase
MSNKIGKTESEGKMKAKMLLKFARLFLYRIRKRMWFLPAVSEMTVDQLFDRINSNLPPVLIDVRGTKEFNGNGQDSYSKYGHIPNAKSIPIMKLASSLEDLHAFREKEIVTICPGGGMSLIAVEIMTEAGFMDVKSLTGGFDLWVKRGYPTTTS